MRLRNFSGQIEKFIIIVLFISMMSQSMISAYAWNIEVKELSDNNIVEPYSEYAFLPVVKDTYMSDYRYSWLFRLDDVKSKLYMTREGYHKKLINTSSGILCDMENGNLSILRGFKHYHTGAIETVESVPLKNIDVVKGRLYILSMERRETFAITAELIDAVTGKSVTVSTDKYGAGLGWGTTNIHIDGKAAGLNLKGRSTKKKQSVLAVMGDSYTEANTLRKNYEKRYVSLIDHEFEDTVLIASKGGAKSADGVKWLDDYFLECTEPQYMLIELGINDKDYDEWLNNMKEIIQLLEDRGVTPILTTMPPLKCFSDQRNELHRKMSDWVRDSGHMYLDFAYAMSKDNDGVTPDKGCTLKDRLHPSVECHREIAELFLKEYKEELNKAENVCDSDSSTANDSAPLLYCDVLANPRYAALT